MHIKRTPLYRKASRRIPWHIRAIVLAVSAIAPVMVAGVDPLAPREQEFIITAYYSPLPDQCCYVTGGYEADKALNGQGVRGADGTQVRAGMAAAPGSYPFGTVIALPGVGRFTVHDRGGAIQEIGGVHRLDIWVGYGEEGLARALAFGVRRIKGTVYPVGGRQPEESFSLDSLPAVLSRLTEFEVTGGNLLSVHPKAGDRSLSVEMLQGSLQKLGFFPQNPTGLYGSTTQESLRSFNEAYRLHEPSDHLSEQSAANILAALRRRDAEPPVDFVERGSSSTVVKEAQRTLRFLGFYRGRTDGRYDDDVAGSILRFQQVKNLVGTANDPGAGRIGPITKKEITSAWDRRIVGDIAERYLTLHRIEATLDQRGKNMDQFLSEGMSGSQVTLLQRMLSDRGYFPSEKVNGHFGELTKASVLAYQLKENIVVDEGENGAGSVGPKTLVSLKKSEFHALYAIVRGQGWRAL